MKNKTKLIGGLILGAVMSLTACGNKGNGTYIDPTKRQVLFEFLKAGLGTEVYENLARAYMDTHPDVQIQCIANAEINATVELNLQQGNQVSDIYCIRDINKIKRFYAQDYLVDLTETYDSEIEDGKKLSEIMDQSALNYSNYNGHYICIPEYVNVNGFVYNKKLFDQYNWQVPKTTEEMATLCEKILSDTKGKVKPFIYCKDAQGYIYYLLNGINASYEGIANMDKIYEFENADVFKPSNRTGKLYALKTMQDWFTVENGYVYDKSATTGNINAQRMLINGQAAMMLNGSWFENEMSRFITPDNELAMFMVPEYSVGGVIQRATGYTSDGEKGVVHSEYTANYIVPKQGANNADAIDFLKFISRKDMCELYTKTCNSVRPFDYNKDSSSETYKDMSAFGKSILDMANNNTLYVPVSTNPLAISGKISFWPMNDGDAYHMNRLLSVKETPEKCLELEYERAKTVLPAA